MIQHGACLGLGIAALGTEDEEAFEDIKNVLYMDNAGGWVGGRLAVSQSVSQSGWALTLPLHTAHTLRPIPMACASHPRIIMSAR